MNGAQISGHHFKNRAIIKPHSYTQKGCGFFMPVHSFTYGLYWRIHIYLVVIYRLVYNYINKAIKKLLLYIYNMDVIINGINFFLIGAAVFIISLFLCNVILKFFESFLFKTQYDSTAKLRYVLFCFVTLILGVTLGKMIIGKII